MWSRCRFHVCSPLGLSLFCYMVKNISILKKTNASESGLGHKKKCALIRTKIRKEIGRSWVIFGVIAAAGKQYLQNFQTESDILHALEKPQALLNMLGLFCPMLVSEAELKLAFSCFYIFSLVVQDLSQVW